MIAGPGDAMSPVVVITGYAIQVDLTLQEFITVTSVELQGCDDVSIFQAWDDAMEDVFWSDHKRSWTKFAVPWKRL